MRNLTMLSGALFAAVLVLGSASQAHAQWGVAPYVGYNMDAEEVHLGAAVQLPLPAKIGNSRLIASPGFDFYPFMGESVQGVDFGASLYMLSFDVLYPFPTPSSFAPYVGAGLALVHASVSFSDPSIPGLDFSASDTDVGLNLKGGSFFGKGPVRPFAEAVLHVGSGSAFLLRGGVYVSMK